MKKILLNLIFLLFQAGLYSQELGQVTISGATTLASFSFITDQAIIIRVSPDGNLLEWGTAIDRRIYNYYPGKLETYLGRVDYYGPEYDSVLRGKVKSIGTCMLSYYGIHETAARAGKLRTVGRQLLDYYDSYENKALQGKLRFAGALLLSYYPSYENEAYSGKLKSIGNTQLTYYSSFDDKYIRGKIKSIGGVGFTWYTQNDSRGYPGGLKSGAYMQLINGVNYILQ